MTPRFLLAATIASSLSLAAFVNGQTTVTSDPVGFSRVECLGGSDTFVSLPFTRPPEFIGAIQSVSGSTITVSGNPWSDNQFVYAEGTQPKRYYALLGPAGSTNPKEGHIYPISGNTGNSLTVTAGANGLSGIPANAQLVVIPYWTLATVFPAADQNVSFTPSTSNRLTQLKTQVLIPDSDTDGVNLAYTATYYFINNGAGNVGWRLFGDEATKNHGDDALAPDLYFVVRNPNGTPTLPLTNAGSVLTRKLVIPLFTNASQQRDNPAAIVRPVDITLNQTGLSPADGSFVASSSNRLSQIKDQLFVYDNNQAAINKSPSATYYYINNTVNGQPNVGWRLFGDAQTTDHGNDVIRAFSGLTIRKAASGNGATAYWSNAPTY